MYYSLYKPGRLKRIDIERSLGDSVNAVTQLIPKELQNYKL